MIVDWLRPGRLVLVVSMALGVATHPVISNVAWADDDDDDDDRGDRDDDDDDEDDDEQPPVTAGGLFTKETYPIAELQRPLTITKGMAEVRLGLDVDVSAQTAFEKWGLGLDARYGFEDNVEGQLSLRSDLNQFSSFVFKAGIEAGIVYDLVDFRLALAVPVTKTTDAMTGDSSTSTAVDFELGFPFRYAPKPEIGIIALDTFMTINTKGKPDLTPSVGIIAQPVEMLAIKLHAKIIIIDFNTDADNFQIPVAANVQFSPSNLVDIGGEFTFPNLKPADPDGDGPLEAPKFYDNRMLLLYGQLRF
jgi:hypothetical protein